MTWKCTNTPKGENKLYSDAKGVVPSLDLRFAEGKNLNDYMTGQNLITFSRSSIGTYVDENGIIQTATADQPRFDHNPTTGESLGLLIEESRTNILLNSATLSTQSVTTSATAYTLSFYGTGTVTLSGTSTAGPLVGTGANDRVTLTFTPTAGTLTLTVTGTVSNAQLEAGSFPTSYIPTTGTALTRSADVASITGANFSRWFVQNNGSFYCKADLQFPASSGPSPIFSVDNSGANSRIASRRSNFGVRNSSSSDGIDITNFSAWNGEVKEFALTWVANDCALVDSGTLIGTDTTTVNPLSTVNQLLIGNTNSGGFLTKMGGHISRLTYFPERLPDSSLQTMTTP